jgi:hypothetical protein
MRTKSSMIKGMIVLVAVVTVFLLLPAAASANDLLVAALMER